MATKFTKEEAANFARISAEMQVDQLGEYKDESEAWASGRDNVEDTLPIDVVRVGYDVYDETFKKLTGYDAWA
tara:strand:- start:634 stop:852 length:219 start_codon:yes stop_codon:yes gene_type:complete